MPATAVVSDTTSYLPDALADEAELRTVSLYVTLAGRTEAEEAIGDYESFYSRLRDTELAASTSQPSIGDFVTVYGPLLDEGREIVSIHLSGDISGTVATALQARERLIDEQRGGERILVVDSRTGCGALGLVVLSAAAAARDGRSAEGVRDRAERAREALQMWFVVDTLEYLRRGGRIGKAQALLGSTLQVKPILTMDGEIEPVDRVRTSSRAYARLLDHARELREAGADGWIVQHVQDHERAERLIDDTAEIMGCEPLFCSEIGPVIGAHVGPGLLGIGGVPRELLG